MAARSIFFGFVGEFLGFFGGLLYFSAEYGIGLYGFSEIQVPNLNFWQKAGNNGVVSFSWFVAVDGAEVHLEPLDVEWEGGEHDLVMHEQVVALLFVDVDFQGGIIFFLNGEESTIFPATMSASVSLI